MDGRFSGCRAERPAQQRTLASIGFHQIHHQLQKKGRQTKEPNEGVKRRTEKKRGQHFIVLLMQIDEQNDDDSVDGHGNLTEIASCVLHKID